jgi:heterodisulfide reductase subunit D
MEHEAAPHLVRQPHISEAQHIVPAYGTETQTEIAVTIPGANQFRCRTTFGGGEREPTNNENLPILPPRRYFPRPCKEACLAGALEEMLAHRAEAMLDSCTRCGKCFAACPITAPAGLSEADPRETIAGVLDIVRDGQGPQASEKWANSCVLSGECVKACDYGVNPRFLLALARIAMARAKNTPDQRRKQGVEGFRLIARDVMTLSRMQLTDAELSRLGQDPRTEIGDAEPPDIIFYTGCNVLKTPHIALLALDLLDAIGVTHRVMGGPTHCCGVGQMRAGDLESSGRFGESTMDKLAKSKSGTVLAWCPTCNVQFNQFMLPAVERVSGTRPFAMTPFLLFLRSKLDRLRPLLRARVPMRVALHRHTGEAGVMEAAAEIVSSVPGIELVDLGQPSPGLMSNYLRALPAYKRELQLNELRAAESANIDALVTVYHADHRELCAHERDWPFRILNALEVVGESMGLHHEDSYKRLKLKQDVDGILADCAGASDRHGLDPAASRRAVEAMLKDQPLPLGSATRHRSQ